MPNSNGYIYIDTSTTPHKGVSFADIRKVLGDSKTTLKGLCQSDKINHWAKYKPVGKNKLFTDDELDTPQNSRRPWKSNATWWKGNVKVEVIPAGTTFHNKVNQSPAAWITVCGIKYLGFTLKQDVLNIFNPAANHWVHQLGGIFAENFSHVAPSGGNTEPFRQSDFNQYWHGAYFAGYTDYATEGGVIHVNIEDDVVKHQVCSIFNYDEGSSLNFNNLFSDISNDVDFEVIVGRMSGSNLTIDTPVVDRSQEGSAKNYIIYMETLLENYTYMGIYCARLGLNGNTYYVPLMQSGGDTPNFTFPASPRAKAYKTWYLSRSVQNNTQAWFKSNYAGTYRKFNGYNTGGSMGNCETLYFKMDITNDTTSSIVVSKDTIKVELAGRFNLSSGGTNAKDVYYQFADGDGPSTHKVSFALRDDEQSKSAWDDEGQFTIPPRGSGMNEKTLYLAMYNVLNDEEDLVVTKGGTVYRVSIWLNKGNTMPSSVFGDMTESGKLNISVSAL